jgi:uncharacterized membrane protein YozB (DUF420 family)
MSSLLNTSAPLISEISVIFQLVSLSFLLIGFLFVKQNKLRYHGVFMFLASILNIITVLTVMLPTALGLIETSIPGFNLLFRSHILLGLFVIGLSGYILVNWRFMEPGPTCSQNKKWMLGLSLAWMAQIIIGILLFTRLYV